MNLRFTKSTFFALVYMTGNLLYAQNSVGIGTDTPNPNAVLELISPTNDQGMLVPRLTTAERTATSFTDNLSITENGLLVFDSDLNQFFFWNDPNWQAVGPSTINAPDVSVTPTGDLISTDAQSALEEIQAEVDSLGTAAGLDAGSGPDQVVQLDGTGALPALDGSNLTGVTPSFSVPFVDDPTNVVFGSTTIVPAPGGQVLEVIDETGGGGAIVGIGTFNDDLSVNRSTVALLSARGSQAVPTAVQQDDFLGEVVFNGNYGGGIANFDQGAGIEAVASENWTAGSNGGELIFRTTENATSGSNERLRISNRGYVGINAQSPLSTFQLDSNFHIFNYSGLVSGKFMTDNLYPDGSAIRFTQTGPASFIWMHDGKIEFVMGPPEPVGTDATMISSLNTVLEMDSTGDARFGGAVEFGNLEGMTPQNGMIQYNGTDLQGYEGGQWVNLTGISIPLSETFSDGGAGPFYLENIGGGGVAEFRISNTLSTSNVLSLHTDAQDISARGLFVDHSGLGIAGEFNISNNTNALEAVLGKTSGTGVAGWFEVDNVGNNSAAVFGRIINGTGPAIEGFTQGAGQVARFDQVNTGNGSIAFSVNNDGTNSVALFQNTGNASQAAVEINNNGSGPGLVIQNPGGTTSFGDVSFINGDLGISETTPSARLDVVGTTELNGNVTTIGDMNVSGSNTTGGDHTTGGAVFSNVRTDAAATVTILATDHIIALTGSSAQSVLLPDATTNQGRELVFMIRQSGVTHSISVQGGDSFVAEGTVGTSPITLSTSFDEKVSVTFRAVGTDWYLVSYVLSSSV